MVHMSGSDCGQIPRSELSRVSRRLASVAAVIVLGAVVAITLIVTPSIRQPMPVVLKTIEKHQPRHNMMLTDEPKPEAQSDIDTKSDAETAKALGLKESDIRLLKAAIHAEKSKDVKTCGLKCGGNDPACVTLCGRPDGQGHAPLPVHDFKNLYKLTKKAMAEGGGVLGLEASDVTLLQSALKQQVKEQIKACKRECKDPECKAKCHKMVDSLDITDADVKPPLDHPKLSTTVSTGHVAPSASDANANAPPKLVAPTELEAARLAAAQNLKLPERDLKLLAAAEGDQAHEEAEKKQSAAAMKQALHGQRRSASRTRRSDWAPGMRSGAMRGLEEERRQAARTAKIAAAAERSDAEGSW